MRKNIVPEPEKEYCTRGFIWHVVYYMKQQENKIAYPLHKQFHEFDLFQTQDKGNQ